MPVAGVIGLGRMGSAIAGRLARNGFTVTGWDKRPEAVAALAGPDFAAASGAREVAERAGVVITSITEDAGVREVFGAAGVLEAGVTGKLFIEMSTLQPATVRALAPAVNARGARIVDAPVLGTIPNVHAGTLSALVGGSDEDVRSARVVLDVLARRVTHLGPLGSGHAMKLAVNLGLAAYVQGLAESLALGEREGLDLTQMLDVLAAAPTANAWIAGRRAVLDGQAADVTLDIRTMRKDIMSAVATGALGGVPMPLAAGVLAALSAAVAGGWGEADLGRLPQFFREDAVQRY